MLSEELFHKIESHLDGETDLQELKASLNSAEAAKLDEQIDLARNTRLAVEAANLRKDLLAIHQEARATVEAPPAKRRSLPTRWLAIAAGILLLLAGFWWLQPAADSLYADYFYQDPGLPVLMGAADDPAFSEAMTLFQQADYPGAMAGFQPLAEAFPKNDTLQYYLGASAFYQGDLETANKLLTEVSKDENSLFQERASWLLVLSQLRNKDLAGARKSLEPILSQPDHRFQSEAQRLAKTFSE